MKRGIFIKFAQHPMLLLTISVSAPTLNAKAENGPSQQHMGGIKGARPAGGGVGSEGREGM